MRLWATAIGVVLLFELRSEMPWKRWPLPDADLGIYHEIARRGDVRAVLHLPIVNDPWRAHYMYYSTLHWKPIANGYSGYLPATYVELRRRLHEQLLDDGTIDYLIDLGVTHVATHPPPAAQQDGPNAGPGVDTVDDLGASLHQLSRRRV